MPRSGTDTVGPFSVLATWDTLADWGLTQINLLYWIYRKYRPVQGRLTRGSRIDEFIKDRQLFANPGKIIHTLA